jgi:hypothetical protein
MFREPTVILGALSEVVKAVIPMLIIFNFINWSGEQVAQVMLVVGVVIAFFNVLLTRSQVVPIDKSDALVKKAIEMPANTTLHQVIAAEKKEHEATK